MMNVADGRCHAWGWHTVMSRGSADGRPTRSSRHHRRGPRSDRLHWVSFLVCTEPFRQAALATARLDRERERPGRCNSGRRPVVRALFVLGTSKGAARQAYNKVEPPLPQYATQGHVFCGPCAVKIRISPAMGPLSVARHQSFRRTALTRIGVNTREVVQKDCTDNPLAWTTESFRRTALTTVRGQHAGSRPEGLH